MNWQMTMMIVKIDVIMEKQVVYNNFEHFLGDVNFFLIYLY